MNMKLITRWLVIMLALFVAQWLVPGIQVEGDGWIPYAIMAAILAFLNAVLLPVLKALSCGLIILTLGLFGLVLNALVFWFSAELSTTLFSMGFTVRNFGSALLGSIIVTIVTVLLSGRENHEWNDRRKNRRDRSQAN